MSALPPKADMVQHDDVRFVPEADFTQCSINCNDEGTCDEWGPEHRTAERPSSAWRFPRGRVLCQGVQNRPIKGREFIFQPAAECLDLRAIAAALRAHEMVGAA
jgi:hypothetical protein